MEKLKENIKNTPPLTIETINKSIFSKLHEIIVNNGGTLMVYEMPLHSVQKDMYSSEVDHKNKVVFEAWLKENNIPIHEKNFSSFNFTHFLFPV